MGRSASESGSPDLVPSLGNRPRASAGGGATPKPRPDEHGTMLSGADVGMPDEHPTTTEIHVELEAVDGGTKMVMTHDGIPAGSPGAAGWEMAFTKLLAYVEAQGTQ